MPIANQNSCSAPKIHYGLDGFSWSLVDSALLSFASCTFAYELVLLLRLPTWSWYPLLVLALAVSMALQYRFGERVWKTKAFDPLTYCMIIVGLACAAINVFTLRPDADDFSYFHRAVFSLLDLQAPIPIFDTAHDINSLPAISPVHLTSSVEVVAALVAKLIGVNPVFFYQNVIGCISLFILPSVYFLTLRHLKFSQRTSFLGVLLIIFLYAFSGDSHRDFGSFTIVRAWQGKCVLITLIVPLIALLTFRFLRFGSSKDLLRLHFTALSAIGLSGTAFLLFPFIVLFSILGAASYQSRQPCFFRRVVSIGGTFVFFAVLFAAIKSGLLPEVINTDVWNTKPEQWALGSTVFKTRTTVYFYTICVVGVLLLFRRNNRVLSLTISSIFICIALVTPPISSLLLKITLAAAYWRLAYASQMLLIMAVFTLLCFDAAIISRRPSDRFKFGLGAMIIFAFFPLKSPAINADIIKPPQDFKFPQSSILFFNSVERQIPVGAIVAIPEKLVPTMGLLRPDIRLISTRRLETRHVFINANRKREGELRVAAQRDLQTCGGTGDLKELMRQLSTLTIMVFPANCLSKTIGTNLVINLADWAIIRSQQYQLWRKLDVASAVGIDQN